MPTGYGTIYNDGVKYLKINKFDANGTDKSDYLAQMTSIRINHGDVGTLQYVVSTTQVQNDYFIFDFLKFNGFNLNYYLKIVIITFKNYYSNSFLVGSKIIN